MSQPVSRTQIEDAPVVVITGAGSGVGAATARLFARRGARIAALGRSEDKLRTLIEQIGSHSRYFVCDVADPDAVAATVQRVHAEFGRIDVAVNAAGIAGSVPLTELGATAWRDVIDTNLSGTFFVAREVGLLMRAQGSGVIVNVASDLATRGAAGYAHYCASKAGVLGLTRALAIELAPEVRVNAVSPGPIDTPMLRAGLDAENPRSVQDAQAAVPLGRFADPAEIAEAIVFLATTATFATGANLPLDGGTSAE